MDNLTLEEVHRHILALEATRRTLFKKRCRDIAALSLDHGEADLNNTDTFSTTMTRIEGKLKQLWELKRLLLIDERSLILKRHPELRKWSFLSPMINVPKSPIRSTPTPTLGMNL